MPDEDEAAPGPYTVSLEDRPPDMCQVSDADGRHVADVYDEEQVGVLHALSPKVLATARLLAASWEMRRQLNNIGWLITGHDDPDGLFNELRQCVSEAVTAAEPAEEG